MQTYEAEIAGKLPALPPGAPPAVQQVHVTFAEILTAQASAIHHALNIKVEDNATLQDALGISKACKLSVDRLADVRKSATQEAELFVKAAKDREKAFAQVFVDAKAAVDAKVQAYNLRKAEEARLEKVRIEAELRAKREAEEADRRRREAEEEQRQIEEAQRVAALRAKQQAEIEKANEGERLAMEAKARAERDAEEARIAKERAERDAAQRVEDEKARIAMEAAERQALSDTARAEGAGKTKGIAKRWTYKVVDPDAVVRALCQPDLGKIRSAVNAGLRNEDSEGNPNPLAAGLQIYQDISTVAR